jgi:hypothetical protein
MMLRALESALHPEPSKINVQGDHSLSGAAALPMKAASAARLCGICPVALRKVQPSHIIER